MGCNTSKDAKDTTTKKKGANAKAQSQAPEKQMSPVKQGGKKTFKEIPVSELEKHKVGDILSFVKTGNLNMIDALINHHKLGLAVMLLNGF